MLSILIPIYNCNTYPLVLELWKQCIDFNIEFEILCQDDASKSPLNKLNEQINQLSNCNFISLDKNVAHRKNRNLLAKKSIYEYLLFIDGDSKIIKSKYIETYIKNLKDNQVIYGGRLHPEACPSDNQKLRWMYGRFMEDKLSTERESEPYKNLLFNNTLILKSEFNKVKFNDELVSYGHDDTQFSFNLSVLNSKVLHIDNQVLHNDIDSNALFYTKMKSSISNLHYFYENKIITPGHSKFISSITILKKIKLIYPIAIIYQLLEIKIQKNLTGKKPKLYLFNFFRLGYFCRLMQ
jgi:hypothetical protein